MADAQPDNPAGRLYLTLNRGLQTGGNQQTLKVWGDLLGTHHHPTLLRRIGALFSLPERIEVKVGQVEVRNPGTRISPAVLLRWKPNVEKAFGVPLTNPWQNAAQYLDTATMLGLEVCAEHLSREAPEPILDIKELAKVREYLDGVLAELQEGRDDVPPHLREFLLRKTVEMLEAIDRYGFLGVEPVRRAFDSSVGGLATKNKVARAGLFSARTMRRWGRALLVVERILRAGESVDQIAERIESLIQIPAAVEDVQDDESEGGAGPDTIST